MNYNEKMEKLEDLMSEIRNYYGELVPQLFYFCDASFEYYTEEDLDDDIKTCEEYIIGLEARETFK